MGTALFFGLAFYLILFSKSASERIRDFTPCAVNLATTIGMLTLSILSFSGVSTFLYFNF